MAKKLDHQVTQQIKSLLLVILSGVGLAILIALITVFKFGPTGQYQAEDVLLSPDLILALSYNDTNAKKGGMSRFVFDSIEFNYYDSERKQWNKILVSKDQYAELFNSIEEATSLQEVSQDVLNYFNKSNYARLLLWTKTESDASWQSLRKVFQEVHFEKEGDYFRVQLRQTTQGDNWAYFKAPNIYREALQIFTQVP